jgi:hypothetical protein
MTFIETGEIVPGHIHGQRLPFKKEFNHQLASVLN